MEQFYYQGTAVVENADADCHSLLKASACCAMWSRFLPCMPATLAWTISFLRITV